MRFAFSVIAFGALLAVALMLSSTTQASPGSWHAMATASPIYLQQSGASSFAAGIGGPQRLHLPSSVMSHTDPVCSSDTSDFPPQCSIFPGPDRRCSAHCDMGQQCSAFDAGPGSASCSVYNLNGARCSVLQPSAPTTVSPSNCSAFSSDTTTAIECSVMAPGKKQACSAQNPATINIQNQCSAQGPNGGDVCSVLKGGSTAKNFCSVGGPGVPATKTCSALALTASCSILIPNTGACTNFLGAAAGTCSAQAPGTFCSVIGGAAGTFCVN